ncbi:E3 ubiquitin-protein ligase TRIM39 [Osmerus mordax]|uniref:E3 ubiquitin-protein ligase TRIM39 n=1 Tax=Osmerus mordax TaxID=8014 RepID=UPI003510165D
MSLSTSLLSEDQFTCSICLDVFTNPVSTPCGHSFCQVCICSYWDSNGNKACQCPLCKESFRKRPELHINRTLKEITEQFQRMAEAGLDVGGGLGGGGVEGGRGGGGVLGSDSRPPVPPRPGEMPVSVIAEMKNRFQRPATSRTPPPVSYPHPSTPQHTLPPPTSPGVALPSQRRFTLSGPADSTPDVPLCPAHLRGLDLFCRTDQTCVCATCVETEHQSHMILPAKREWQIKKSQLGITEVELRDLITERERKVEEIKTCLQDIQVCAERETQGTVHVFTSLVASVQRCQAELLQLVETARRAAHHHGQALLRELEQDISELKKKSSALTQLGQTDDCVLFLRVGARSLTLTRDWSDANVTSELSSGLVLRTVNQMVERFQEELRRLPEICGSVAPAGLQPPTDQAVSRHNPKVRKVQEYAADVTLDLATAHPRLLISEDRKQVRCSDQYQPVQDGPQRFNRVVCVLGQPGFSSGRHYWEVEVGGKTDWDVGVASSSINRKGKITVSPAHGYWFLSLRDRTDYAFRTEPSTALGLTTRPGKLGVFVDYEKGQVSFYDVEAKLLIYTYTDRFSDTIHPFFSPCTNKSGCNEAPLVICPISLPD